MVPIESRDKKLTAIDHLGQTLELPAVADEIGAHGEHDVDRHIGLRDRFEKHADKFVGHFLLRLAGLVEAKDLLELVDDQQEVGVLSQPRLLDRFDQAELATAQCRQQIFTGVFLVTVVEVGFQNRIGQERQGIAAGMRDRDFPRRTGAQQFPSQ